MALTAQDKLFCEEYAINGYNGVQAYQKAFPNATYESARVLSCKKLKKQEIRDYVIKLQKEAFNAKCITAERIADELASLAFEKDGEKVSHTNKLKAIDLLQKQMGLQQKKIDAAISEEVNISITIGDEEE